MRINILGFSYEVKRGHVIGNDAGVIDHVKQTIVIDHDLEYEGTVEALLHEIIHGIEFACELTLDERSVSCISRGLYSVLTDDSNDDFWIAVSGSDEIMGGNDVDLTVDEVLEGTCPGCSCGWSYCYCDDLEDPEESSDLPERGIDSAGELLQDQCGYPRAEDPETEYSYQRFADHCREEARGDQEAVVTTTEDHLPG